MVEIVGIDEEYGRELEKYMETMPLADFLQIRMIKLEKGAAELVMELDPSRHGNPNGTVQGGALSTLADITSSFAVTTLGTDTCTVSGKIDMLRGKVPEGTLRCRAEVFKAGGTLIWVDMWIRDENESLIARGEYLNFRLPRPSDL